MHTERVLGSARLSRSTEESVSIESQTEDIRAVAAYRNARVVHVAVDDGVSGGLSPFERGGLGEWLTDPGKLAQWDTLAVAKLDRLSRSIFDFATLISWAEANGKNLISRAESIDLSTAAGRLMARIVILFAEFERERMSERQTGSKQYRRQNSAWGSGRPPFGYATVRRGSLLYLEPHPVRADVWRDGAKMIVEGATVTAAAAWLSEVTGMTWDISRVTRCYRNPVYAGYVTKQKAIGKDASGKLVHARHETEVVTDADGQPVTHDAPLITPEGWQELQAALDRGAITRQNPAAIRELSGIVVCADCGAVLSYQHQDRAWGSRYRHYGRSPEARKCRQGGAATLDAAVIEEEFREQFLEVHGDRRMVVKITEGEDLSHALQELEERRGDVEDQVAMGSLSAASGTRILARIEADLDDLRKRHGQSISYQELDLTLASEWEKFTASERNQFLRSRGVSVLVRRGDVRRRPWVFVEHGALPTLEAFLHQPPGEGYPGDDYR